MMFGVRKTSCSTCIYRSDSSLDLDLDLDQLERQVQDDIGFFQGYRICHHSKNLCCRGFWNRHKNEFPLGQIAQRLGAVDFRDAD